jgi:hypothetical protein
MLTGLRLSKISLIRKEAISTSRCLWSARREGNKPYTLSKGGAQVARTADYK